ncbi:MAG TPA: MBL fold metallo-hydrolase [Vicinamibacterales bacterium]|nr:MBL fold metallo-hydrolase [Vicinamibacterales bacterium]
MARFTEVAPGVAFMRCAFVNIAALGDRSRWILVDAGLQGYGAAIRAAAEARFGPGTRPSAIVLTHGHFDHVGALNEAELLADWDVPIFAHALELPYLTGRSPYPPPDPLVGRGAMALLSRLYPRGPIDLGGRVHELPSDGSVPDAPGWRWVHTPGHTPGHVSLFRDLDRTLLAADALTTTKQESMAAVLTQRRELHGPPAYYTQDWDRARESFRALVRLAPDLIVSGHGQPSSGRDLRDELTVLADNFDRLERPAFGRYARQAAVADETGVVMLPPDPLPAVLAGAGAMAAAGALVWMASKRPAAGNRQPVAGSR